MRHHCRHYSVLLSKLWSVVCSTELRMCGFWEVLQISTDYYQVITEIVVTSSSTLLLLSTLGAIKPYTIDC